MIQEAWAITRGWAMYNLEIKHSLPAHYFPGMQKYSRSSHKRIFNKKNFVRFHFTIINDYFSGGKDH